MRTHRKRNLTHVNVDVCNVATAINADRHASSLQNPLAMFDCGELPHG